MLWARTARYGIVAGRESVDCVESTQGSTPVLPAAVSWGPGRVDLLWPESNWALWHNW